MRLRAILAGSLLPIACATACWSQPPPPQQEPTTPQRSWGPEQATGEPDTFQAGDIVTAWATRTRDAPDEWLQLEYADAVPVAEVCIWETYNPGAVCKVTAFTQDEAEVETEVVLWEGEDPTEEAPAEFVVEAGADAVSSKIRVYLDSMAVPGWNEIDAVELVGQDGSRQWAERATASSTYAEQGRQGPTVWAPDRPVQFPPELAALLGVQVTVSLTDVPDLPELTGTVVWVDPRLRFVLLDDAAGQRVLVGSRAIVCVEPTAPENTGPGNPRSQEAGPEGLVGRDVQVRLRSDAALPGGGANPGEARVVAIGPDWGYLVLQPAGGQAMVVPWDSLLTITYRPAVEYRTIEDLTGAEPQL